MAKTYWAILKERNGAAYDESFDALADVIEYTARLNDFHRMTLRTLPVAHARNAYAQGFYYNTPNPDPDDTLVMLDVDHDMEPFIVQRLAAHSEGVVGAFATSRGETPFAPFFQRGEDGVMYALTEWTDGELVKGTLVGTGAIAIKRWVLETLKDSAPSWFRYTYVGARYEATEDMYFGYECEKAGIPHYLDTSLWIPHITTAFTTPGEWREYLNDHPEAHHKRKPAPTNTNGHEGGNDRWQNLAQTIQRTS